MTTREEYQRANAYITPKLQEKTQDVNLVVTKVGWRDQEGRVEVSVASTDKAHPSDPDPMVVVPTGIPNPHEKLTCLSPLVLNKIVENWPDDWEDQLR